MEPDTKGNVLDIEVGCIVRNTKDDQKNKFPGFDSFRCENAAVHDHQVCPPAQVLQNHIGGGPSDLQRNHGNTRRPR